MSELSTDPRLAGRCACGAVTYTACEAPLFVQACHCRDCQRTTGSGFVVHIVLSRAALVVLGETRVGSGPTGSGAGCELNACAACGVILWTRYLYHEAPVVALRAGTLLDPGAVVPQAHIFVRNKLPWLELEPDMPTFEAGASREQMWPAASLARYAALAHAAQQI